MAEKQFTQTVEKPIAGLEIRLKCVDDSLFANEYLIRSWINTVFKDSVTASVAYKDKDGNETNPFSSFNLDALLEHAQAGEGYIPIIFDGSDYYLQAFLPLTSNGGAIQFSNDETMTIDFKYDDTIFETLTTETIESPVASPTWTKFERFAVRQDDLEKDLTINGAESIMIPIESLFTKTQITLCYSNGQNVKLTKPKIQALGRKINDACYNVNGQVVGGFGRYAIIDVRRVERVEIRRDTTAPFQIIVQSQEPVANLGQVQAKNMMLVDTSTPFLDAKLMGVGNVVSKR